jgi:hypothetical protein
MAPESPRSAGARVYALLLHLYPTSFRREYGDSMLQLFEDQRRAVHGSGGYAMLWWKTLRDLVRSVPAAHSHDGVRTPSMGPAFVWSVVVLLGLVFLVNAVVLPAWIGRMPSDEAAAVVEAPVVAPTGEYRVVGQVAAGVISTLLALGGCLLARRQRGVLTGAAVFVAGAILTFMALAMNPWLWLPLDRYPVAIAWALAVWPLLAFAWIVLTVRSRRRRMPAA